MTRYRDSNHRSISAMMQGHNPEIPKHGGKQVCLVWGIKGECHSNCRRKDMHVRYSPSTIQALGKFLTDCGVAESG